jgi:hypothetical protein
MLDSQASTPEQAAEIRRSYAAYTPMLRLADPKELAGNAALICAAISEGAPGLDDRRRLLG